MNSLGKRCTPSSTRRHLTSGSCCRTPFCRPTPSWDPTRCLARASWRDCSGRPIPMAIDRLTSRSSLSTWPRAASGSPRVGKPSKSCRRAFRPAHRRRFLSWPWSPSIRLALPPSRPPPRPKPRWCRHRIGRPRMQLPPQLGSRRNWLPRPLRSGPPQRPPRRPHPPRRRLGASTGRSPADGDAPAPCRRPDNFRDTRRRVGDAK